MKKLTPKQIKARTFLILGIGLLTALCGLAWNEQVTVIMIGLLIMFAAMIHHVIFYRCPHCGKYLDRSTGKFCPGCGKDVNQVK